MKKKLVKVFTTKKIQNSIWMVLEKVLSIFGLIFVTSFVAKYIGPDNFGKLTFTASIFAIIQTIAMFGLENIIFHQTIKDATKGEKLIHFSENIRSIIFYGLSSIALIYFYINMDTTIFIFSVATCISVYFALHDVYVIYFNGILKSKINTICNSIGLLIALLCRYFIADLELKIEYLSLPIILTTLIPYLIRKQIYTKRYLTAQDRFKKEHIKKYRSYLLGVGRKLILYSLSVAIFTKTSQIFLGWQSTYELGLYTVLVTLGTSFYFVFNALILSFMTDIYQESSFNKSQNKVAQLNLIILIFGAILLFFGTIFNKEIINKLYGQDYVSVAHFLPIMIGMCILSGISTVSEKYLIKFSAYSYLQKKTNILLIFNIILTFLLVEHWGLSGAIWSIFITELATATIFNYFYKSGLIFDTQKRIFMLSTYSKK